MRISLLMLGLFIFVFAYADVYQTTDEEGNVVYSDKPSEGAKKIEIEEVQTIDAPKGKSFKYTPPKKDPPPTYTGVSITSPENNSEFRDNEGNVTVSVTVAPRLLPNHHLVLYMDGKKMAEGSSKSFNLQNVDRGTHSVSAAVLDGNGKELKRSPSVSFTIHRFSVEHPPADGAPPPAP